MITNKDISAIELSPVKTDFYQQWNELMDAAKKLSERWDPSSTNESDPGIVLLKTLVGIADKLNYNIDKNILEAFMPSAAQVESMRKLCDMLGYNMKYYQSAETAVTFIYNKKDENGELDLDNNGITIPIFTNVTNADKDVNYVTTEPAIITKLIPNKEVICIEGQLVQCENDNDNIISLDQLNDQFRYYLPESQVAENGVFVYNISDQVFSERWQKVDNLNIQSAQSKVYKFGYDSKEGLPYIQFTEDVAEIIEDGFVIYYIRTSGVNGNISAKILSTFEAPADWEGISAEDFTVTNKDAAQNGCNEESITDAYNNFKKTIGTFDTLVTCRDYINKIYQLMDDKNIPLCSNVIVSDIRDDINRATTLCSFNEYGICYVDKPLKKTVQYTGTVVGSSPAQTATIEVQTDAMDHFDLLLYPFKTVYGLNTKSEYKSSFKYTDIKNNEIKADIADYKTIAHQFKDPNSDEIVCIKNYLKLNAKLTTIAKVNKAEESIILANVRTAIYEAFNMRKLDFGEEIPFDSILDVIEGADSRIKNVTLDEPELYTRIMTADNNEYDIASTVNNTANNNWKTLYNKLALRNILAGRVELFKYDKSFKYNYDETGYGAGYSGIYPVNTGSDVNNGIFALEMHCNLPLNGITGGEDPIKETPELADGEVIQFRAPNFKTTTTYSTYVNYHLHLNSGTYSPAIPATIITLKEWVEDPNNAEHMVALGKAIGMYTSDSTASSQTITQAWINRGNWSWNQIPNTSETTDIFFKINETLPTLNQSYNGLYRQLSTYSDNYGKLINKYGYKYQKCSRPTTGSYVTTTYYVQQLHDTQTADHTCDGLGKDAVLKHIAKGSEYQLKKGNTPEDDEWLFINYTESTKNDDGSEGEQAIKNILYMAGTIIKPNFAIEDTPSTAGRRTRTKKGGDGGFTSEGATIFPQGSSAVGSNIEAILQDPTTGGLLSLGANEQLEIRDYSRVTFKTGTNFYLASEARQLSDLTGGTTGEEYILDSGEYLYYTDSNKLDYAYFGPGTGIYIPAGLTFPKIDSDITPAEILAGGISVIPWQWYNPSAANANPNANEETDYIHAQEYQYLTLTSGDRIKQIKCNGTPGETGQPSHLGFDTHDRINNTYDDLKHVPNKWHQVGDLDINNESYSAVYVINGTETRLPKIDVEGANWEVRSLLTLKASSDKAQVLYKDYDHILVFGGKKVSADEYEQYQEYLINYTGPNVSTRSWLPNQFKFTVPTTERSIPTETAQTDWNSEDCKLKEIVDLYPHVIDSAVKPLSFKVNYLATAVNDIAYVQLASYDEDGKTVTEYYNDFSVKDYYSLPVTNYRNEDVTTLNNLNTNWTSIPLNDYQTADKAFTMYINIPTSTSRGAIMIYYATEFSAAEDLVHGAWIELTSGTPKIFNNGTNVVPGDITNVTTLPFENNWQWWIGRSSAAVIPIAAVAGSPLSAGATGTAGVKYYTREASSAGAGYLNDGTYAYTLAGEGTAVVAGSDEADKYYPLTTEGSDTNTPAKYHLKPGVNVVWLSESCALKMHGVDGEGTIINTGSIVFSDLDIIDISKDNSYGITLDRLGYKALVSTSGTASELDQIKSILDSIKEADPEFNFYYNCKLDNSNAIDFNDNLVEGEIEALDTPKIWYDANNINNKFVISEIDADYLEKGIIVARTSKLK